MRPFRFLRTVERIMTIIKKLLGLINRQEITEVREAQNISFRLFLVLVFLTF